jgi:hypothetical protein
MNDLIQQTGAILTLAQELLKLPGLKETVRGFGSTGYDGMGTL